jgi:hypothetical protein
MAKLARLLFWRVIVPTVYIVLTTALLYYVVFPWLGRRLADTMRDSSARTAPKPIRPNKSR